LSFASWFLKVRLDYGFLSPIVQSCFPTTPLQCRNFGAILRLPFQKYSPQSISPRDAFPASFCLRLDDVLKEFNKLETGQRVPFFYRRQDVVHTARAEEKK